MKLQQVLPDFLSDSIVQGTLDITIDNITYDSRKVTKNSLFFCIRGANHDGHVFIPQAIEKGASAIVLEQTDIEIPKHITVIQTSQVKEALAHISSAFYGHPTKQFHLIGVTGTNGKTTITHVLNSILSFSDRKVGTIGTLGSFINSEKVDFETTTSTTPESSDLQFIFNKMNQNKVDDVVIEVTSIGLDQKRLDSCSFDIGIFTNLTQDHLDYHGTMEHYKKSKLKLFEQAPFYVVNSDDPFSDEILEHTPSKGYTYGIDKEADFRATNIKVENNTCKFTLHVFSQHLHVETRLLGKYNIYNILASVAAAYQLGISVESIVQAVHALSPAAGRLEAFPLDNGATAVVDYAHTPDALENVLKSIRELNPNRIITVFGCGGDRDTTKRPIMGKIASVYSDHVVVTSDNPRTENPDLIIEDIIEGMKDSKFEQIADRKDAIIHALKMTTDGDIVLVAGKGHETYQIIGDTTISFDDRLVIKSYMGGNN